MNYQHKVNLVEAEKYRVLGQKIAAIEHYDRVSQIVEETHGGKLRFHSVQGIGIEFFREIFV